MNQVRELHDSVAGRLPRILVLDDDESWLEQVPLILEGECQVDGFPTIEQGLSAVQIHTYDAILLDLNFQNDHRTGLDVFRQFYTHNKGADVIIISGETHHQRLIELFNAGVSEFISKPCPVGQIRDVIRRTLKCREVRFKALDNRSQGSSETPALLGSSPAIQLLRQEIQRMAGIRDVLLLGETGTGKEVVARMIAAQAVPQGRFIVVNCGALSEGLVESELFGHTRGAFTGADRLRIGAFEAAEGGFVFLDELGEMPVSQQAKLLRVLQERKVQRVGCYEERNVRFRTIAATHVDLERAVQEKHFREDLYYRIARETLRIPPLRERLEDIPELVYHTLAQSPEHCNKTLTQEAMRLLQSYPWPGNVRQLIAVTESLGSRAEGDVIREKDVCKLLPEVVPVLSSRLAKALVGNYGNSELISEKKKFESAILQANGDRTRAAEILGLSRATFFRKAKDLGLVRDRKSLK